MQKNKKTSFDRYYSKQNKQLIKVLIEYALEEDIGDGDITTSATVKGKSKVKARIIAKEKGVICGLPLIPLILKTETQKFNLKIFVKEGDIVKPKQIIAEIKANAQVLLKVERVLLNFLQHLSGVSSLTFRYIEAVKPYNVSILDTRKTMPLFRLLQKYAVMIGGGENHRFGLYDQVLIKDNHIQIAGGIDQAILNVRRNFPRVPIEVETRTLKEVRKVISYHPEIILLDNMSPATLQKAVQIINHKSITEASGGINLNNIRKYASTGVDRISIGMLTHSAPALDISMKILL